MNTVKTCRRCSEEKPIDEFYKKTPIRYDCYCLPCKKILLAEYYEKKMGKKTEKKKLDSLTDEQIKIIVERYNMGVPTKKIAESIGIPMGKLYNWKHQGLFNDLLAISKQETSEE